MKLKINPNDDELDRLILKYVSKDTNSPKEVMIKYTFYDTEKEKEVLKEEKVSIESFSATGIVIRRDNNLRSLPYTSNIEIEEIDGLEKLAKNK